MLGAFAREFGIPVAQPHASCVNLPASHAMNLGQGGGALLPQADLIIVVDSEVPWFPRSFTPSATTRVVHLGIDPLYQRYPIRSFPTSLAVPGHSATALERLAAALHEHAIPEATLRRRRAAVAEFRAEKHARAAARSRMPATRSPISYAYLAACLRDALPSGGLVVTELGVSGEQLGLEEPGSLLGVGIGGGLGFALGASLGAKLAAPERCVISTLGDGSYMFGNPTPFHFVARAAELPVLTIVCNNSRWQAVESATRGVYPHGRAAASEAMPLVELQPSPEFCKSQRPRTRCALRVDDPAELRARSKRRCAVQSGQQALLDVRMEHGIR